MKSPYSNWPTEQNDMEAANYIVDKYLVLNEGEPLGFLEIVMHRTKEQEKNKVELKMPDWIVELQAFFREKYGSEQGHEITSKVLTKYLLKEETLH